MKGKKRPQNCVLGYDYDEEKCSNIDCTLKEVCKVEHEKLKREHK